jgi:hypothetical protein
MDRWMPLQRPGLWPAASQAYFLVVAFELAMHFVWAAPFSDLHAAGTVSFAGFAVIVAGWEVAVAAKAIIGVANIASAAAEASVFLTITGVTPLHGGRGSTAEDRATPLLVSQC